MAGDIKPVWVTGHRTNGEWSFVVSDDNLHSLHLSNPTAGSIPLDKICSTYQALSDCLRSRGFVPPSLEYFTTHTEDERPYEDIIRMVTEPRQGEGIR